MFLSEDIQLQTLNRAPKQEVLILHHQRIQRMACLLWLSVTHPALALPFLVCSLSAFALHPLAPIHRSWHFPHFQTQTQEWGAVGKQQRGIQWILLLSDGRAGLAGVFLELPVLVRQGWGFFSWVWGRVWAVNYSVQLPLGMLALGGFDAHTHAERASADSHVCL